MHFNHVITLGDFSNPILQATLDDIFGDPAVYTSRIHRKSAEVANAIRALQDGGAMHSGARILGVGAGKETTIFYLTRHVAEVHATDLYVDAGIWEAHAPGQMLVYPESLAPYGYDWNLQRLIVQHMDARDLRYPDNHFDGVFTSSSIEHFGSREDVAAAAREIGRVLKPGGIASISTEWMISGGDDHCFDGVLLFDEADIQRDIVEPSGLEMIDALETEVDDDTKKTMDTLENAVQRVTYPHVVLYHKDYLFASVHLALRKPDSVNAGKRSRAKKPA